MKLVQITCVSPMTVEQRKIMHEDAWSKRTNMNQTITVGTTVFFSVIVDLVPFVGRHQHIQPYASLWTAGKTHPK